MPHGLRDIYPARLAALALCVAVLLSLAACGGQPSEDASGDGEGTADGGSGEQAYPDVEAAELERSGDSWSLSVTVSSPYDSPERYADGWRVLSPEGEVLGEHELGHDHADEQPFTRTQTGLEIPEGVEEITVEGRDLENGYGGETVTVPVER